METKDKLQIANETLRQIKQTAGMGVYWSWGVSKLLAQDFKGMVSVCLKVNGFIHKGWVVVSLDEGEDLYNIYLCKNGAIPDETKIVKTFEGIFFDQLGSIIDENVERGTCSLDEYEQKIKKEYNSL